MTDDSATLRAMATRLRAERREVRYTDMITGYNASRMEPIPSCLDAAAAIEALLASQSSWAKEKAELERQRDEAEAVVAKYLGWRRGQPDVTPILDRHASRPVTVKE